MSAEEKKEFTPRSFRISDETYQQLKELSGEISGKNQDEVFAQLIRVFKMEKGKTLLPDRRKEIADFQNYTELLTKMFIHSLEDYATLEDKTSLKYEEKLSSKDLTILQLQEQMEDLKKKSDINKSLADRLREDNVSLSQELEQTKKSLSSEKKRMEKSLDDKEVLIQELKEGKNTAHEQIASLTMELSVARTKLGEVENLNSNIASLSQELEETKKELDVSRQSLSDLEKVVKADKTAHTKELKELKEQAEQSRKAQEASHKTELMLLRSSMETEKQSALLELEKSHKKELEDLKNSHAVSIEKLQEKYERLLEKLENVMGLSKDPQQKG